MPPNRSAISRELAKHLVSDLWTFATDGKGLKLYEQPHREMCAFLEDLLPPPPDQMEHAVKKFGMMLEPRETLKTTLGAETLAEYFLCRWKVLYDYDGRIGIVRANREAAMTVVSAISQDFTGTNPVFLKAFGDMHKNPDAPVWRSDKITFNWRTTSWREPSIYTAAPGTSLTGFHLDLIIVDDLANETNYLSDVEMTKARTYLHTLEPVLNAWGSLIVIGTRWSHSDPYGSILEINERHANEQAQKWPNNPEKREPPPWKTLIRSVYNTDGSLLYPAYLTEKRIEQKRKSLPEKLYTAWYLNAVVSDSGRVFKPNYLRFYEGDFDPEPEDGDAPRLSIGHEKSHADVAGQILPVRCTIHCDPAVTVAQTSNFTAYHVVLTDEEGRHFVYESFKARKLPSEIISELLSKVRRYLPPDMSIDVLGQQILWVDPLAKAIKDAGLRCNILQYKGKGKDQKQGRGILGKAKRIEALEDLFRRGLIYIRRGACAPLLHEYEMYDGVTPSNHYDSLDALSHILTMTSKPAAQKFKQDLEDREWAEEFGDDEPRRRSGSYAGRLAS